MKKLQWDSDFWGVNVFHLTQIETLNFGQLGDKHFLIQALPNVSDLPLIHRLEDKGFKFQESKVTFLKNKFCEIETDRLNFRALSSLDLKPYEDSFFELYGKNTRYDIFDPKKVNEFYYTWLTNSTDGQMDDECIGYFINGQLAGFVTYKTKGDFVVIGLLGVLPHYRGYGISQYLLNYVDNVAVNTSSEGIKVSTQGKNISAINSYIKNGYNVASIDHWYYLIKGELK